MTRNEILQSSIWEQAKMNWFSPFFNREVTVNLYAHHKSLRHIEGDIISETMVRTVNDFLSLNEDAKPLMNQLLYKHCLACCEDISYGVDVRDGETETEANLREFGVKNESDALEKANLHHISIEDDELEQRKNRYVKICFYPEWETEHGCELILRNGELLDYSGEHGTYLTQFE